MGLRKTLRLALRAYIAFLNMALASLVCTLAKLFGFPGPAPALAEQVQALTQQAVARIPGASSQMITLKHSGIRVHAVTAGPEAGPLVICVHGFPCCWIETLAKLGYRVVAYDQRGYNLSDKPSGVDKYTVSWLTQDLDDVRDHFGAERFILLGHDWGGVAAWHYAMRYGDHVAKLVTLNSPHPALFMSSLMTSWEQRIRSWYVLYFQIPVLADNALSYPPAMTVAAFWKLHKRQLTQFDKDMYATAIAQPGAMTCMLNYYRAMARSLFTGPSMSDPDSKRAKKFSTPLAMPVLVLWGDRDAALSNNMLHGIGQYAQKLQVSVIKGCSHWVMKDAPGRVNSDISSFLGPASR